VNVREQRRRLLQVKILEDQKDKNLGNRVLSQEKPEQKIQCKYRTRLHRSTVQKMFNVYGADQPLEDKSLGKLGPRLFRKLINVSQF
jgi:hypothetical protein